MNKYTKEMSESEILIALANIRTELLNAVDAIKAIAKNIEYKGGDTEQVDAVHGKWVRKYDDKVNCYWYECDQCGEYRPRNQFGKEYNANFCPNCGAIMYKGGEEE